MYTLISDLYTKYCGYPQYNLAILGLQKTGKTQLLKVLKDETTPYIVGLKQSEYKQTIGLNTAQIRKDKFSYLVWDLGGKHSIRKIWECYYPYCHGLIFVFDHRIGQGLQCLKTIVQHQQMALIPILIYVRSTQFYTKIKDQLAKWNQSVESMSSRTVNIQLLPHNRERLFQHLQELYGHIRNLQINIRK